MTASHRMTLTAALASALSSTALYPLFTGSAWFYAGLGAIVAVAGACTPPGGFSSGPGTGGGTAGTGGPRTHPFRSRPTR